MEVSRQLAFAIEDPSQVGEARRHAVAMARDVGFTEERAGAVALAVTEAATNIVKHAARGAILVQPLIAGSTRGIEVVAIDRGPGISNLAASLRDGHSTAGSAGIGLGTLSRLSSDFDVYSQAGAGTTLRCVFWAGEKPQIGNEVESGVVCVPIKGETVAGDDWSLQSSRGRYVLFVVDGLGHGPDAAAAAAAAKGVIERNIARTPAEQIQAAHAALRATRGAAAAVIELKPSGEVGTFCGIGNIGCFVRAQGKARSLASHNGILGHQMRTVQEFSFPFPPGALLYAYSDGMTSRWDPASYAGLESRHPALIAATLYRDHNRGRDDTTIAVVRNIRAAA
jgi:anti-sigma regulatory factor (Ser/Thr protein kinase)